VEVLREEARGSSVDNFRAAIQVVIMPLRIIMHGERVAKGLLKLKIATGQRTRRTLAVESQFSVNAYVPLEISNLLEMPDIRMEPGSGAYERLMNEYARMKGKKIGFMGNVLSHQ